MKTFLIKKAVIVAGMFILSSCSYAKNQEDNQSNQTDILKDTTKISNISDEVYNTQNNNIASFDDINFAGSLDGEQSLFYDKANNDSQINKDNELESLIGEYDYLSDYGIGKLIIKKTSYGYDISDYESEASYRFLADSSNIDFVENNKIYIKYPEKVFSDDTVIFSYYILEYSENEISVYYKKSENEKNQFLYNAKKKNEEDIDKAIELYVNVLQNYISEGKTDFTVSFIDLDGDSTREMVVFFGESQADGGYLFTIKNEEAIHVLSEDSGCFGQYGGFTYKEKGNVFVTENESVTEEQIFSQIFYYTMENGNAVCKDVTQSITQFDSDEGKFYVNDTEVGSEKFNSIAEKYGLLEMSTVSYSDGVLVMNEQMDKVYNAYSNEYPLEFSMGDNLKAAITSLAVSYENFDKDVVNSKNWKEIFIAKFIQNSRLSFDYLDMISDKNNGQISIDELNYIQYSLTNTELDFSSYDDNFVNRNNAASSLNYGLISGYDYKYTDSGVIITADLEIGYDGTQLKQKREITAELVKNPYSCFDGYSVISISSNEITSSPEPDNSMHIFYGTDIMEEHNGVFAFEFLYSEDNLGYKHFVYVDMEKLPKLAEFVRQNAGKDFKVAFIWNEGNAYAIEKVVPTEVLLNE